MYVTPKEASKYYSVSENALRWWANSGQIKYITTKGGHRRYFLGDAPEESKEEESKIKVIYARVSSAKQKSDLERQEEYLRTKYPEHTLITDTGSGINFERRGFKRILEGVFKGNITEVVVAHRDRFTRFGYNLFEWIFKQHGAELVCDEKEAPNEQEELTDDLMSIITVFSARHYGRRKYANRLLQESTLLS